MRRLLSTVACVASLSLAAAGCAAWQAPADVSDAGLRDRAVKATKRDVRVSAAVLSADDSRRMLGVEVDRKRVQPVWIEVQNQTADPLWLLRPGTDPDYFSPLEIAWSVHMPLAEDANARIDEHLNKLGFKNPVLPDVTHAGLLFINPEHGVRLLNIDLLQRKALIPFSLFLSVPDDAGDERFAFSAYRYPDSAIKDRNTLAALRSELERLPCCATDPRGTAYGAPLNIIFVGESSDIGAALARRSYRRDMRPVDAVEQVFGRRPDIVGRKQSQAGAPATWVRAWLAPIRFEGRSVYLVQVGRPVGGRFAPPDATSVVLHEDVDEARNLLIQDMMYSGGLDKLGFVTGAGPASPTQPPTAFSGARYQSDGLRAVMFFATRPIGLSEVEFLDWEPYLDGRRSAARDGNDDARK
ncbi:LssY C-terminal domain-containing protein [Azospirillum sp. TSO22-1]|uniref:LssY C-terminal domain-containing protein n=1 Tax=Azospirillum sp. TSO22-1 TaxID=716789 RepID=UPI0018EE9868|nr:LssY C-terminal domain-containing protein [Azospirillum sp. TSO22-1]